ncbi:SNF2 family N-terminal domain-containing protein [Mycena sp. CBHHK59/15]|nr:SNF2 family N-terminal domain-containing protein [Mycena sp. CBHHK59/15]
MASHAVGYSKSSRAKCHGPEPCKGSSLPIGTLRYGQRTVNEYGDTVEWRHWGCVTPSILSQLATQTPMDRVAGFDQLSVADQQKIRAAISRRRVDPNDIPATAKTTVEVPAEVSNPANSQKKRKAAFEATASQASSSVAWSADGTHVPAMEGEALEEEVAEVEVADELYVSMKTNVVGVQYYKGLVGAGEEVMLNREPTNQYDRNAIQVKNISRTQVGHLPKAVAGKLAPLLDRGLVNVEGMMTTGNLGVKTKIFTLDITLKIYGSPDKKQELELKLIWATPGQRGFQSRNGSSNVHTSGSLSGPSSAGPSYSVPVNRTNPAQTAAQFEAVRKRQEALQKAADLKKMLNSLEQVDDEERRSSLLDQLLSTDDVLNLPLHPSPPGIGNGLVVDLLRHQSQALQWAVERENPVLPKIGDKPVQLWQQLNNGSKTYYYNLATKTPQEKPPVLGRGALCADSMGLGKTLTMLALILTTKADVPRDFSNSTLIVAPLSVISNWEKQIEDQCVPGSLSYFTYYGSKRDMSAKELQKFDVVITTYQTVAGEHDDKDSGPNKKKKKVERSLFETQWKRIVLDEAHTVRNPKTKMAKAVCALAAQRRWALAATPIINSPKDLGSLLTFLQICRPLDQEDFFKRLLLRPLKDGDPAGAELLRGLMSHICIRRTKEMQDADGNSLVPLPPVEMIIVPVALSDEARAMYDEVEQLSKQRLENMMRSNSTVAQSNVLSMLTRMRQLVLHTGLVPTSYIEELKSADATEDKADAKNVVVTPAEKLRLQAKLAQAIEECEECPICFDTVSDPRITSCAHVFCLPCITTVVAKDPKCPLDRRILSMGDLHSAPPPTELTQAPYRDTEESNPSDGGSSAKIDQLIQLLTLTPSSEKSLVFSQFTTFLDKVAERLESAGIAYVRFDGRMSAKRRQEVIAQFSISVSDDDESGTSAGGMEHRSRGRSSDGSLGRDEDSDFVMNGSDDDDDFLDFEDGIGKSKRQKVKGKGKGKQNAKASSYANRPTFTLGKNPKVMLISLKAGALGLNLTVANNVYLMDPWWQEGIESQAIDRVNRIGQRKPVHVYQLIAERTVESKVLEIQNRKKKLIQEAFSGMKRTETQRQQKEARLQDLIELFGVRQQAPLELVYSSVDGLDISLDVFVPESATETAKVPVFIWWHGGGLLQGTRKATSPHHLSAPAKHNLCIVSADYRLAPQTRLPGILADCTAAMDFVRSPAFAFATGNRVDASKMVLSGSSAGGWLSLLAGTGIGYAACGLDPPAPVSGIAALYPITDLTDPFWTTKQYPVSYMPRIVQDSEVQPFINPDDEKVAFSTLDSKRAVFYHYMVQEGILESLLLDGTGIPSSSFAIAPAIKTGKFTVPPTYVIHGDIDDKVPCRQARDVVDALKEVKADVEYEELPGVDHLFDKDPKYEMENMYAFVAKVTKS